MRLVVVFLFVSAFLQAESPKMRSLQIERGMQRIVREVDPNLHWGVEVISLKNGKRLFERNSHQLFIPASTVKLFTAAAALEILGPTYAFETTLLTSDPIENGTLQGDLFIKGGGDPSLAISDLESMVRELKLIGMHSINGDLYADHSLYDEYYRGPGWMWDDVNGVCFSPLSALTVNHSCLNVWVKPARESGPAPQVFAYPKTPFVSIVNRAKTERKTSDLSAERPLEGGVNTIQVRGSIGASETFKTFRVPLENPHLFTASVVQKTLNKAHISTKGNTNVKKAPEKSRVLASHLSAPLSTLLLQMMKDSDNLYADALFKMMGAKTVNGQGNWTNGSQAIRAFLEEKVGLEIDRLVIHDGSGLSRYNMVCPHHLIQLIQWMNQHSLYSHDFFAALPFVRDHGPYVRAKTGTMTGVSSLAGIVYTKGGEPLVFAVMSNGFTSKAAVPKHELEDKIVQFLVNLE